VRGFFSDDLVAGAAPRWAEATAHRFTRELADDTLDDGVWRRYLVQDYAFVEALTGLAGFAVGRAPTMAEKSRFAGFLSVLTGAEDAFFKRAFAAAGVPQGEWADATDSEVTAAFRSLFGEASAAGYAETLSVFLPVEWVYLTWATAQAGKTPRPAYDEWIRLHNDPGFRDFVMFMKAELDRVGAGLDAFGRARCVALFRRACELEVAFFDSVYG
jgi:thiaminase/transcriptional activator TenA